MKLINTDINEVFLLERKPFIDQRGVFIKTYNKDIFSKFGLEYNFTEAVYSVSKKNVLRGMHFQQNPHSQVKVVNVVRGEILDVVVCVWGKNRGKYYSVNLSENNNLSLYIPKGYAHGFLTLSDEAIVSYITSDVYVPECDTGIKWNSFGFNWPNSNPILSEKDKNLETFDTWR